jgi:adenylate cyclase class 1
VQRFKYLNQCRLRRVQAFFQPRQQDFLQLLPLLFHINHPLLPGFVSLETPFGLPDYAPDKQTLDTVKQFCKSFDYKRQALRSYPIYSLFLMGSVGSMAFSKHSDIDIWLCHQPELTAEQLVALRHKTSAVETWAATLKIEVHFFLVNSEHFNQGVNTPISVESSGETQHYLLLE